MHQTCSIDGCGRPAFARGWCSRHYQQQRKSSTNVAPLAVGELTEGNWAIAVCMWRVGKDTADIAEWFGVPEAHVYKTLPDYLAKWRSQPVTLMQSV